MNTFQVDSPAGSGRPVGSAISSRRRTTPLPLIAAVPAIAVLCARAVQIRPAFIDDAYVFYRYATNWAHGLGLVFNSGEQVEGYSSFLWTALLTVAALLGISPTTAGPALGLACAIATVVVLAYLTRQLFASQWVAVAIPLALALCYGFAFYAVSGMDTAIFALILTSCVAVLARHVESASRSSASTRSAVGAVVLLVVLVLARAEGPLYALVLGLAATALARHRNRATLALPLAAVVASACALLVRHSIYGAWVPATVSAKGYTAAVISHGRVHALARVVRDGLTYEGGVVLVVLAAITITVVAIALRGRQRVPAVVWLAAAVTALDIGVTALNSGDWMAYRRLLVSALPLVLLLAAWSARSAIEAIAGRRTPSDRLAIAGVVGACALTVYGAGFHLRPFPFVWGKAALTGIGQTIRVSDPTARVLTDLNGVMSYYAGSRAYIWDLFGLTDAHNARHGYVYTPRYGRTDPVYDFSRNFDVMVANSPWDWLLLLEQWRSSPARLAQYALLKNPSLASQGILVIVRRGTPLERGLARYCRCPPSGLGPALTRLVRGITIPSDAILR